jgi:hypothetical protein
MEFWSWLVTRSFYGSLGVVILLNVANILNFALDSIKQRIIKNNF